MQEVPLHPVTFLGAGAVARHLIPWFQHRGLEVIGLFSRTASHAHALAAAYRIPHAGPFPGPLPEATRLLILSTPDEAIASVAETLSTLPLPWPEITVLHLSGALASDVLAPLARAGARTLSFHPLQTFPRQGPPVSLAGLSVALEGPHTEMGMALAERLAWKPFTLSAEARQMYHLAATMAANYLVTLHHLVTEALKAHPGTHTLPEQLFLPIMQQVLTNLTQGRPGEILTGPIRRGDLGTVRQHLTTLARHAPHLLPVYVALGVETAHLARKAGHLSPEAEGIFMDLFLQYLDEQNP